MFDQITTIADSIVSSLLQIWPYLLVTIPLAVAVRMSGASKYIGRAFQARPILAIFLATAVGAFSPFCSCGVVPVVAALLISGVPLAPVMSFWIGSPSMDPEILFLSVATIGWELAVWRLAATLLLSLGAGLMTRYVEQQGWLGPRILRSQQTRPARTIWNGMQTTWRGLRDGLSNSLSMRSALGGAALTSAVSCCSNAGPGSAEGLQLSTAAVPVTLANRGASSEPADHTGRSATDLGTCKSSQAGGCGVKSDVFWRCLLRETWDATWMVVRFMLLASFLSALITLYVPSEWVVDLLGNQNPWSIPWAALLGVPAYASNLTALPMLSGLLAQGMSRSAALAFLISGPTTTLPAMAAVWGLTSRRVFALYVSFSLVGAVVLGYVHSLVTGLF
jgi:uncharacterized membrane protein YraQ (UPF0718 family)